MSSETTVRQIMRTIISVDSKTKAKDAAKSRPDSNAVAFFIVLTSFLLVSAPLLVEVQWLCQGAIMSVHCDRSANYEE